MDWSCDKPCRCIELSPRPLLFTRYDVSIWWAMIATCSSNFGLTLSHFLRHWPSTLNINLSIYLVCSQTGTVGVLKHFQMAISRQKYCQMTFSPDKYHLKCMEVQISNTTLIYRKQRYIIPHLLVCIFFIQFYFSRVCSSDNHVFMGI